MWCSEARMAENMGAPRRTSTAVPVRSSQRGFRKAWTVDATMPPGNGQYRQQNPGGPLPESDVWRHVWRRTWGRRTAQAPQYQCAVVEVHATFRQVTPDPKKCMNTILRHSRTNVRPPHEWSEFRLAIDRGLGPRSRSDELSTGTHSIHKV
jgi:hypothetical protein